MITRRWYDESGLVETDRKCQCGYHYSDSYGSTEITLRKGKTWRYNSDVSGEEYERIALEIKAEIKLIKQRKKAANATN